MPYLLSCATLVLLLHQSLVELADGEQLVVGCVIHEVAGSVRARDGETLLVVARLPGYEFSVPNKATTGITLTE